MKVQEFIEYMGKNINATMKDKQILSLAKKQLEVKKYISIKEKKELVDKIIGQCVYYSNNVFKIDSIDCYIYFTMFTIDAYTSLEIDDAEESYNMLAESGLLPVVITALGQEYHDVNTFLDMKRDEILENNSIEMQLSKFFEAILDKANDLEEALPEFINNVNVSKDSILKIIKMIAQK